MRSRDFAPDGAGRPEGRPVTLTTPCLPEGLPRSGLLFRQKGLRLKLPAHIADAPTGLDRLAGKHGGALYIALRPG